MGQKAVGFNRSPPLPPRRQTPGPASLAGPRAHWGSYQLAEVVAADLDHLALVPDADHAVLHMHLHAGHWGRGHGQPHWVAVHQAGLHLGRLHLLCGQEHAGCHRRQPQPAQGQALPTCVPATRGGKSHPGEERTAAQGSDVNIKSLSRVRLFATPQTIQSMEFSRPQYRNGSPFPSPEDLPNPGIEPRSPALQRILYQLSHKGSPTVAQMVQ